MVTISKVGDSTIKFEFTNNDHYLYNNGEISVPINSLILVTDDTDLVVFKKIDGDVFVTFLIGNSNFSSKDELVAWYKENMVDGGGSDITSGDVQNMIDASISGKQDTLIAGENISISGNVISAEGGKAIEAGRGISVTTGATADTVSFNLPISAGTGSDSLVFCRYGAATGQYSTAFGNGSEARNNYAFAIGNANNANGSSSFAGGDGMTSAIGSGSFAFGYNAKTIGNNSVALGGYFLRTENESEITFGRSNVSRTGSTDDLKTIFSVGNGTSTSARHNAFEIRKNGDIYITSGGSDIKLQDNLGGGGNNVVELTQAEYDALVSGGTVDPTAFYIITDAVAFDPSTKVDTSAFTAYSAATNAALSGKQDTLSAGTGIDITNNVISATGGGGGKAIEAGRGISVTTGATADTVSFNLPISANSSNSIFGYTQSEINGDGNFVFGDSNYTAAWPNGVSLSTIYGSNNHLGAAHYSYIFGYDNSAGANHVYVFGRDNSINANYRTNGDYNQVYGNNNSINISAANKYASGNHIIGDYNSITDTSRGYIFGRYDTISNEGETALGYYNLSNSGLTDADNTLFSVGNGTADNARHNAFEIRQNGDIYYFDGTNDVKLQDKFSSLDTTIGNINTILESI